MENIETAKENSVAEGVINKLENRMLAMEKESKARGEDRNQLLSDIVDLLKEEAEKVEREIVH